MCRSTVGDLQVSAVHGYCFLVILSCFDFRTTSCLGDGSLSREATLTNSSLHPAAYFMMGDGIAFTGSDTNLGSLGGLVVIVIRTWLMHA